MKKLLNMFLGLSLVLTPLAVALPAQAVSPTWNVTGSYTVSFDGYVHDMSLVQDGSGNLTGSGGYPASGPYTFAWALTSGTVVGDAINLTADYNVGAIGTTMHMAGTIASNGTMSGTWDDNYGGSTRTGTWATTSGAAQALPGTLSAEDFGVVSYDTGLGMIKGYTAGFGLTDATLAGTTSVVVKLYSDTTLLQTNTAILPKFNTDITGTQFSSPFDVSGNFAYATDGYWTNVRESQYGQSVPATKVIATVTLANGKVVTAENTTLTGDPTTIYPVTPTTYALDVALAGTGVGSVTSSPVGINCGSDCTEAYTAGTAVTLTAVAATGSTFAGYTGACTGTGACVVTVDAAKSVTATFTLDPIVVGSPTDKNQCKADGWKSFTNPTFKNQGQCVSYVQANEHAGKK